ncbi:MAG: FkbM family methyltransferase [Desulfobacteria bacterium]
METFNKSDSAKFFAHHIGGRAGSVAFPDLTKFREEIVNVIYDADASCLAQIEDVWYGKNVLVLPYCLSNKCGPAKFNINYDPYGSSLFPLNPSFGNFYIKGQDGSSDGLMAGVLKTEKIIDVETHTLDSLVETNVTPPPDFLSIDTQGAELLILEGALHCLNQNIVAVEVEINLAPLYEGAPLFGQLDEFLRKHNFLLVNIETIDIGYKRISKSCRGAGIPLQGEALYLLKPDSVKGSDNIELTRKLEKLAFAALAFGYTEVAFDALERSVNLAPDVPRPQLYQKFLCKFFEEVRQRTDIPLLWHEIYSFEESDSRFAGVGGVSTTQRYLKLLRDQPFRYSLIITGKILRKIYYAVISMIQKSLAIFRIKVSLLPKITRFDSFLLNIDFHGKKLGVY